MQDTLSRFSERFDDLLVSLKDKRFQIAGPDTPDGIFDISITNRMLFVVRSVTQTQVGLDDFLRMIYLLFWGALEPSLGIPQNCGCDSRVEKRSLGIRIRGRR